MQIEQHGASRTMLGSRVHAADASVVRLAPVGLSLLFWRNWPQYSFMMELSWKSEGGHPKGPSRRLKDEKEDSLTIINYK